MGQSTLSFKAKDKNKSDGEEVNMWPQGLALGSGHPRG